ncbi:hypothetical protein TWF106_008181 [Orbilia oligospora]|uniref:Major facilitator superfamily (MFS) profile domain-containing protein n=1 Tax=Orbilia oligospora TaxID=2813651 RepID=A0A7C8V2J0_ORBOL|nr:hypothetical protein TWF679_009144 [Orbilia oligospora]KAF3216781.1 hypothetical protein TWF106_008181 [Orbilia oligospora]KAF3223201.1 hypothetical protein TWF191_006482 [Orbilia oligospora]
MDSQAEGPEGRLLRQGQSEGEGEEFQRNINRESEDVDGIESQSRPLLTPVETHTTINSDNEDGEEPKDGVKWWKRPSIIILLPPFVLYAMALGAAAVPRVNMVFALVCQDYLNRKEREATNGDFTPIRLVLGADNPECEIPEIGARAATFTLYMNIITGILSAITSPRLGQYSDRMGRRMFLILGSFGACLCEVTLILCLKYPEYFSHWFLLLASAFEGIVGAFTLILALVHSYASDCTSFAKRSSAFSLFHGFLFLGIAIGPAIGGFALEKTDDIAVVFYGVIGVHVVFISYILLILPESLSKEKMELANEKFAEERRKSAGSVSWLRSAMGVVNVFKPLNVLWPEEGGNLTKIRTNMILLAAIDFVMFGVGFGSITVILLYSKVEFHWTTKFASYFTSFVNASRVIGLFVILPLLTRFFRKKPRPGDPVGGCDNLDTLIIRGALSMEVLGTLFFVVARDSPLFMAGGIIASFGGLGSPTIQSSLTKHSPSEKTGQLLGVIALLHSLARVIGPTAFNGIYSKTAKTYPQSVFVVLVVLFVIAWLGAWFITPYVAVDGVGDEAVERLFAEERGELDESEPLVGRN